ncbi:MAG: arginase [Planctomycetota bacterium]|nr:arginase [Planctomycetota bacterium]
MLEFMETKGIHILGVPIGIGGGQSGTAHGPHHAREAGIVGLLSERLPVEVEDLGDVVLETGTGGDRLELAAEWARLVRAHTCTLTRQRIMPLVIGGDHSLATGSIAGVSSGRRALGHPAPGVLWFDAHTDINTHESTPSGNPHGMSAAALVGLEVEHLSRVVGEDGRIDPDRLAFVGARDIDDGERTHLEESGISVFTSEQIHEDGIASIIDRALDVVSPEREPFCLSFDIDVVDPVHAPGVDTGVEGGLDPAQTREALARIGAHAPLLLVDAVELNPETDHESRTTELMVSCLEQLLTTNVSRLLKG